jgi:hypothetical protein
VYAYADIAWIRAIRVDSWRCRAGPYVLVSEAEVSLKGGVLGRLAFRLVAWQIGRVGRRTLAAFRYLVEEGEAPPAKHSRLRVPAAAC